MHKKEEKQLTREHQRLKETKGEIPPWQKWGPYVSERSWGTVREDYSWNGDAWNYFPFEDAHRRVYRWGEDGIAGLCDRYQVIVFAPAFWNGKDPILKERLFGLSSLQGNHGEDVKEYYYHLDSTPTHSYMKYLYKYPQNEFPYQQLRDVNAQRGLNEAEFELADTGIFSENRYFDIFIEYAKDSPEDIYIRIEAFNRGDVAAPLHIIPQLFFRNQWAWREERAPEPEIRINPDAFGLIADDEQLLEHPMLAHDYRLSKRFFYASPGGRILFTNNENALPGQPYLKDAFHEKIVHGKDATNPDEKGTKACIQYVFDKVPAHKSVVVYFRLTDHPMKGTFDEAKAAAIIEERRREADEFYATVHPIGASDDEKRIQRQALAGMLWTKQIYLFDVNVWLQGDNTAAPPPASRQYIRDMHWKHLNSMRIFSMPDKWEYPWFAAWDLAFHCVTLALVDMEFAKEQLWLLLFDQFQHPNGAIPAYEWEYSDLNPPVQSWAVLQLYQMQREKEGVEDRAYLKKCFLKLVMNFSWWVNRIDSAGCNVFEGGFLGLDNITIIDRSKEFEKGVTLRQSDGTGWMAFFCLNLMRIALELAKEDKTYEAMATKFFQHYIYIAHAMKIRDNQLYELWSERDGFFYDVLCYPDGSFSKFRVRSLVGIIPLYATEIITEEELNALPEFKKNFHWFLKNRPILTKECVVSVHQGSKYLLALVSPEHLRRMLHYVWDPNEFRSEFGLRSLSKIHEANPFFYKDRQVGYEPGDSCNRVKGGNSNWRGPIWFPTSYLLIQALHTFAQIFKDAIKIEVAGEAPVTIEEIARSFAERLVAIFRTNAQGIRPVYGEHSQFGNDPNFKDLILFFEFYHGDTGKGHGASHQTGWSGLVANLIQELRK